MGMPDRDDQKSPVQPPPVTGTQTAATAPMYTERPPAPTFQPQLQPESNGQWSVGLWDCFSDFERSCGVNGGLYCLIGALTGCACIYSCFYRTKMRGQYKLQGSPVKDCFMHCCCEPCALTQEYRELQDRGFDVSIGWQGNVERQSRGVSMPPLGPPVMEGGMKR
ncbi:hypothetical protein CRG98_009423 [Punica granatum]|uniref:Protein PLANT CADMIUM RESISTANCE 2-like n=1 Tax=Punica granatum TaxID=22663 RepID=A0A2I0KPE7_PUNGR|nr:hypothetical protein CRG98_009423 [Punica granatum]